VGPILIHKTCLHTRIIVVIFWYQEDNPTWNLQILCNSSLSPAQCLSCCTIAGSDWCWSPCSNSTIADHLHIIRGHLTHICSHLLSSCLLNYALPPLPSVIHNVSVGCVVLFGRWWGCAHTLLLPHISSSDWDEAQDFIYRPAGLLPMYYTFPLVDIMLLLLDHPSEDCPWCLWDLSHSLRAHDTPKT